MKNKTQRQQELRYLLVEKDERPLGSRSYKPKKEKPFGFRIISDFKYSDTAKDKKRLKFLKNKDRKKFFARVRQYEKEKQEAWNHFE